jgi:hypothetical protein
VLKHQLNAQEEPVSRDAVGGIHIKNDVQFQGPEAMRKAIQASNLPAATKAGLIGQVPKLFKDYQRNLVESVESNNPDLQAELGISSDHVEESFNNLKSVLNNSASGQALYGANVAFAKSISAVERGLGLPEWGIRSVIGSKARDFLGIGEKPWIVRRADALEQKADATQDVLNFSHEFNKKNVEILGTDAGMIGQAAYGAAETVAIGALTGPMAPAIAAERIAEMGESARRIASAFNAISKTAPLAGISGLRRGIGVYDQAHQMGLPTAKCAELALTSGAIDAATTLFFAGTGALTVESIASGAGRAAFRDTLKATVSNVAAHGALDFGGSVTSQVAQTQMVQVLDTALVQLRLHPDMTVEEFNQAFRESVVSTLLTAAPISAAHSLKNYLEVRKNNAAIRNQDKAAYAAVEPVSLTMARAAKANPPPGYAKNGSELAPGEPLPLSNKNSAPAVDPDAAREAQLGKMPPVFRDVFEATNSGMAPREVAEKCSISERGVGNILREITSRIPAKESVSGDGSSTSSLRSASADQPQDHPIEKTDKASSGIPELLPETREGIARSAARLRSGEPVATVLHDDLADLTRQANEQGHLGARHLEGVSPHPGIPCDPAGPGGRLAGEGRGGRSFPQSRILGKRGRDQAAHRRARPVAGRDRTPAGELRQAVEPGEGRSGRRRRQAGHLRSNAEIHAPQRGWRQLLVGGDDSRAE